MIAMQGMAEYWISNVYNYQCLTSAFYIYFYGMIVLVKNQTPLHRNGMAAIPKRLVGGVMM